MTYDTAQIVRFDGHISVFSAMQFSYCGERRCHLLIRHGPFSSFSNLPFRSTRTSLHVRRRSCRRWYWICVLNTGTGTRAYRRIDSSSKPVACDMRAFSHIRKSVFFVMMCNEATHSICCCCRCRFWCLCVCVWKPYVLSSFDTPIYKLLPIHVRISNGARACVKNSPSYS